MFLQRLKNFLDRFFSDRFKVFKILVLAGVYLALAFYFRAANPAKGAQWQRVVFRAAGQSPAGGEMSLTHARVGRLLDRDRGAVLLVGWPQVEVTVLGLKGVEPGDMVDLSGPYLSGTTMGLSQVRVHEGSHRVKVGVSLAAALAALVLFLRAFRIGLRDGVLFRPREN